MTENEVSSCFASAEEVFSAVCEAREVAFWENQSTVSLKANFEASRKIWEDEARDEAWRYLVNECKVSEQDADEIVSWL